MMFLTVHKGRVSFTLPFEETISTGLLTALNGRTLNVSPLSVLDGLNQGDIFPAHFLRAITGHLFHTTKLGKTMQPQKCIFTEVSMYFLWVVGFQSLALDGRGCIQAPRTTPRWVPTSKRGLI